MLERKHVTIHLLILIGLSILTIVLFFKYSTEDSYITYRYAKNLVDGKGFVYNPGEGVFGTTAPFYGLILAFFGFLGFNIPYIGGVLSTFSLGLAIIILYLLTLKKGYPLVGLLCGLFIFLNPWFLQTFGPETYFELLLVISAFYFYDQKKYLPTVILCAFAFLVRADGIIPAVIILLDYIIENRKFPFKGVVLFTVLCIPLFLFCYINFNSFLPATLEAKQALAASGLSGGFLPGFAYFAGLILEENLLLYGFIPLLIIGGILILFFRKTWLLIASWVIIHILGYALLRVAFYHWYFIPFIFLLMLMSAFSIHFIVSVPGFLKENQIRKWNIKMFNQEIDLSIVKFKDISPHLGWVYRILSFIIIASLIISLFGGIKAYYYTYRSFPFPKLELYTKAGKWVAENTPLDARVAYLEVGYFGYHAQRRIIDLVGLVTPGISRHIRKRDFQWALIKYKPDYFIYNTEFESWVGTLVDHPIFVKSYKQIMEMNQSGYLFNLKIFKKILPLDFNKLRALTGDSFQEESDFDVGEIIEGIEIGQTFYCNNNDLVRIKVMLATYNRENHQEVIFHLKRSPADKEDIYTEKFNASSVIDNAYRTFDFPPIDDSKGKTFYFYFKSPLSKNGDAITIWTSEEDKYDKGAMYINGKMSTGDLRFITYFYANER